MSRCIAFLVLGVVFIVPVRVEPAPFLRGDPDGSGELDLSDPILILATLFFPGPGTMDCRDAADVDDGGVIDISDPIALLSFLFLGGRPPAEPFPACGEDSTPDGLDCLAQPACAGPDAAPPVFLGGGCTEKACFPDPRIPLRAGSPLDIVVEDSCNECRPPRFSDDRGIALLEIALLEGDPASGSAAVSISMTFDVPARLIELAADAVLVLDPSGDPLGDPAVLERRPIPAPELRIPAGTTPGGYTRRFVAIDAAGNWTVHDRPAVVSAGEAFEIAESEEARDVAPDATPSEISALTRGNLDFAAALHRAIRGKDGNLFSSPYSISMALAMTWAGARGETARQMADVLGFQMAPERVHEAFNALDLALSRRGEGIDPTKGEGFRLRVANSLWGQRGYAFRGEFLDTLAVNYGAGMRLVDFLTASEPSRLTINGWVSDETEGKVLDLLPPGSVNGLTRLVITNAIYFKASWKTPFPVRATEEGDFHLKGGGAARARFMQVDGPFGYAKGEGWQAVELPYAGDELSMVAIVPDAGRFDEVEASLDGAMLASVLAGLEPGRLVLTFPRFRFEADLPLKQTLIEMGMPDAFSETAADLSGIDGGRSLFIHAVLHKALIGVDEAGTEAAAATAVIIGPTSVPPEMRVDRPFLFLIRDIPTGAVLFLGRLMDPRG